MDLAATQKLFQSRFLIYHDYVRDAIAVVDFDDMVHQLFEDIDDDIDTWKQVQKSTDHHVPIALSSTWDSLYRTICSTIDAVANIKVLRGL